MKKTWIIISLIISGLIFLFLNKKYALLAAHIPLWSVPSFDQVRVDFVNESTEIVYVSFGTILSHADTLQKGERHTVVFDQSSEGVYQFTVGYPSGHTITESRYVEGGYFVTETIKRDTVIPKY